MDPADQPVRLGASVLGAHGHMCAFFHDRDEEYRAFHIVEHGRRRGFRQTRFVTHMEWALANGTTAERLSPEEFLHELRGRGAAGDGSA